MSISYQDQPNLNQFYCMIPINNLYVTHIIIISLNQSTNSQINVSHNI